MRAEEQMQRYRDEIVGLRSYDANSTIDAAAYASMWASFSAGFLFGAGLPAAAATIAHLYRRAYPGADFPMLWEGEAP